MTIARRIRLARRILRRLNEIAQPGISTPHDRVLCRRIRRVLTLTSCPIELRLHDSRAADMGRRMARLAGCPEIWHGTAWQ